jgi:hypothetical protein
MGANGVLLMVDEKWYNVMVGAGFDGVYYLVPLRKQPRTAVAAAIFVHKE